MKKFCKDLREHSTKIINYGKKKMISLTTEEKIHYNKQKVCYICIRQFNNNNTTKSSSVEHKKATKSKRSLSLHRKI